MVRLKKRLALWVVAVAMQGGMSVGLAQMEMGTQQQTTGANQSIVASLSEPVTGEAYQAEKVMRSVQTLADGTVITHETKGTIARDAQGRIREDLYLVHSGQMNGKQVDVSFQSATVGDPVAHTITFWTGDGSKMAMQMQMPSLPHGAGMKAMLAAPPPPTGAARRSCECGEARGWVEWRG